MLGMHSPANDVVRALFRADWGKVEVKTEQVHVEHEPFVVRVVCPAMSSEAAGNTGHVEHCVASYKPCYVLRGTMVFV